MDRLEVGDVITYLPPPDSDVTNLVTHRIVSARRTRSGNIAFRTQGDANPDPDPWTFSLTGRTVAKVGAAADWTPPAVSLTSPGSPVKDTVNLTATATDGETGIKSVTIEYLPVDGSAWSTVCTVGTAPYTCSWDSKSVPDGSYDLRARATDNAGYASTSPTVRTTVANKLPVVLDAPGDVVRGTVSLSTTVYNSGSTTYTVRVEYSPSGANSWKPICTNLSAPYACSWVTTTFGNDYVDLRAVAVAGGTATSSAPVTDVLVDNEAPTVTMIDPGTPLSGARTFAVDARDANSGVAKVVIQYANRGHDDVQDTLHADRGAHLVQLRHRRAVRRHLQLPRRRDGPSRQRDHLSGGRQPDRGQHGVLGVNGRPGRPPQRHGVAVRHGELVRRRDLGEDPVRAERTGSWSDVCADTTSPYACSWDTTIVANGLYDLRAVLLDGPGRTTVSAVESARQVDNSPATTVPATSRWRPRTPARTSA